MTRSTSARSSAVSAHDAAATLASICSAFVAPAITDATSGCDVCHPVAKSRRL